MVHMNMITLNNINFYTIPCKYITDDILKKCSELFSDHYGIWGNNAPKPLKAGAKVKLNQKKLRELCLFNDTCYVTIALSENKLVGHSFFVKFECVNLGEVRWITQLVVHKEYRSQKIGQNLIAQSLGTTWKAAGMVTSHPYVIRALENATKKKADPRIIKKFSNDLVKCSKLPYLSEYKVYVDDHQSIIDTSFQVDHSEVLEILEEEKKKSDWRLGHNLPNGYEFFAFVFNI